MPDISLITKPGIYRDFPSAAYFDDPCPTPSFTQSIGKTVLDTSPLHAMHEHPRLAPPDEADDEPEKYVSAQAIGNAAHAQMIGRGKDVVVADFDSWRTDKAKAVREAAETVGKVAILEKHARRAAAMVHAARKQLASHEAEACFMNGHGEVVLAWQEDGFWFRALVDWLHADLCTVDDFKTTGLCVHERHIPRLIETAGWDIQAAMILRGLDALDPKNAGRRKVRFVPQENWRPFALNVVEMTPDHIAMGRRKLEPAIAQWKASMARGEWPGYPARIIRPELDEYAEGRWLKREIHEAALERVPSDVLAAG